MYRKHLLLVAALCSLCSFAFGQSRGNVYFDGSALWKSPEPRLGLGFLGAQNRTDMDFGLNGNDWQYGVQANVVALRFLHINADYSVGKLVGGPLTVGSDAGGSYVIDFSNKFSQFSVIGRILPLRVFMWDQLDPWAEVFTYFYAGFGYGSIKSNVTATRLEEKEFGYEHNFRGTAGVFIQEYGIDLPLFRVGERSQLFLNLSFRFNKSNSDKLDGYEPTVSSNQHNDVYSSYNAGLTFKFL